MLAYQVALVHLLAIRHWTHFAALVISLALLGFGASGSILALVRPRLAGRERAAFAVTVLLCALSFDAAYRLSTAIPFDAFELLAVPRQALWLTLTYVVLSVPFFLGACAIALAFELAPSDVARVYAANLAGSGAGALLGLLLVSTLPAERLPGAVGLLAAFALLPLGRRWVVAPLVVGALALALPPPAVPMSSYKDESLALALPDARVVARRDGSLGRLDLVSAPTLRYLPGASLALTEPVPARPVLYRNGQPLGFRALPRDAELLAMTTAAAAFALPPGDDADGSALDVLIVGLGGGGDVVHARRAGASPITAVDPDGRLDTLLAGETISGVDRVHENARAYLHRTSRRFDRILVSEVGSLGGVAAGMAAAGEDYLLTVEGVADMWDALAPDGTIAVTRWVLEPPRDVLRLLATARRVLDAAGLDAGRHVALVRGWGTATLLLSRAPLGPADVRALRTWADERWFDVTWAPGAPADEANRYNVLEPDVFRIGAERLLGADPDRFVASYPFDIAPVEDDAPFFHHFLPLRDVPGLWRRGGRLALPYVEWGLVAQLLALVQAVPIAAVLILLPPAFLRLGARADPLRPGAALVMFAYFALLGVAYMLLEIAFIQRLILFLAQPVYAATAVLTAFLVFAGLGSAAAPRLRRLGPWLPFGAVAVLAPLAYALQDLLWRAAAGAPLAARMALAVLVLAPLAFAMGMPFPLGLQLVADRGRRWLTWCWGVNGYLSVVGAATAPLLALSVGFRGVVLAAAALYLVAGLALARLHAVRWAAEEVR